MKNKERFFWISVVFTLLAVSTFSIFVRNAQAGSLNSGFPYMHKFVSVLNTIKLEYVNEEKINDKELINGAIKGMLDSLEDPYTQYLSVEDMKDMTQTSTGTFGGVGMIISEKDDYITVVSPIEDTPAFRKGMKAGDMIVSVDGETLKGVSVSEAANRLKGTPGTKVVIEVVRDEIKFEVELIRAIIDVPTVKYDMINDKYAYLRITHFTGTTDEHVIEALNDFKQKNAEAVIVDLRWNPGGLLSVVAKIVDFFQDSGVIVSTKGRKLFEEEVYNANPFNTLVDADIPVIVLIDAGSASASEIYAGAIKDTQRGILIGEKSYGKGSVQTIHPLGEDGYKITIAKYYTPSGVSIDGEGIHPNIEIKEPELTDEQKESLRKIYQDKVIDTFTSENKNPSDTEITAFIEQLQNEGYDLPGRSLRKLVKNSLSYTNEDAPIYDLEYDIQLKKAIEVLDNNKLIKEEDKFILSE